MLPERMKKGTWLYKDEKTANRIAQVKRHPEYKEERRYVLEWDYGMETDPLEHSKLIEMGYKENLTPAELNKKFRKGEYLPRNGKLY